MERRNFLKMSAALSAAATITGCNSSSKDVEVVASSGTATTDEVMNWSACTCNCFLNCALKVFSKDGIITRVESDNLGTDDFDVRQARACPRGRAVKLKVDASERIKYPMKRVGRRGEGKFVRISWDEAISTIAQKVTELQGNYGPESIYSAHGSGTLFDGVASGTDWTERWLALAGGFVNFGSTFSLGQFDSAATHTFGSHLVSSPDQIGKSDFVLSFGYNPNEMNMGGLGAGYCWVEDTAKDIEVVILDPRYTDSALGKESRWIGIRPGTDAAVVEGIAYYLITNNLANKAFLDKYCIGYDSDTLPDSAPANSDYKSHILGLGTDGIPKTPTWAAKISGVPAQTIEYLAQRLSQASRPFVVQGGGAARQAAGEFTARSVFMLPLLVGKLGIEGTNTGYLPATDYGTFDPISTMSALGLAGLQVPNPVTKRVHCAMIHEAVRLTDGGFNVKEYGLIDADNEDDEMSVGAKMIYGYASNSLINQHQGIPETAEILRDESLCELIVLHDVFMTASCKFADILLPGTMDVEQDDLLFSTAYNTRKVIACSTSVRPAFEAKSAFEVGVLMSKALGFEQEYTQGMSFDGWKRTIWNIACQQEPRLPSYEEMLKAGIVSLPYDESTIACKDFIEDPITNPLTTPSGKIEIYSETYAHKAATWILPEGDVIPAIPMYLNTEEGYEDEETKASYPYQLINFKTKRRAHSQFDNNAWLAEAIEDVLWMNPNDAAKKKLASGDKVKVTGKRGAIIKKLRVTPRVVPGVLAHGQGGWYNPDGNGVDMGGNPNTLIALKPAPVDKNMRSNTVLVDIEKFNG